MKWEYAILSSSYFENDANPRLVEVAMNRLGADGWELVANHRSQLIFKRPLLPTQTFTNPDLLGEA